MVLDYLPTGCSVSLPWRWVSHTYTINVLCTRSGPKRGGGRAVSMLSAYAKPISNSALALQTHMVLCIVKGLVCGCGRRGSVAEDEQQVESKPSKSKINVETTPCDAPAFAHLRVASIGVGSQSSAASNICSEQPSAASNHLQ